MAERTIVFVVLLGVLVLFVSGRWRYDVVALLGLLALVLVGIVPTSDAFVGFGEPAVITVAAVLVISRALQNAGTVELMTRWVSTPGKSITLQLAVLMVIIMGLSAFMNNVGALALMMPVALRIAAKAKVAPSIVLMPLAFGSLLGGMTTLIGTPPNILIASFRAEVQGTAFSMFDFAPVGLGIAVAGLVFIAVAGWRILPIRKGPADFQEMFQIGNYIAEVRVGEGSKATGSTVRELETSSDAEVQVLALVRGERRLSVPSGQYLVQSNDILVVEAGAEALKSFMDATGVELVGSAESDEKPLAPAEVGIVEAVVMPDSFMVSRTPTSLNLRSWYGINLLAVARQGTVLAERMSRTRFRASDVLLLQGNPEAFAESLARLGCLPLAERRLNFAQGRTLVAIGVFAAAILLASTNLLSAPVALVGAAVGMLLLRLISLREAYASIDWSIIVLIGAMIPVGNALAQTGGAQLIADGIRQVSTGIGPAATVGLVLVASMFLSDIINNAAAVLVMAPIAVATALGMGASPDPFLMAVAIGASSAFLTPIGHQSNTLVLGPGGYRFGDFWKLGLPLEVVIVAVSLPLLLRFWPL